MNSADTLSVTYEFTAHSQTEAEKTAGDIALEQTAELPAETIPPDLLKYVGTPKNVTRVSDQRWSCSISYRNAVVGDDILQFLNVLFGNISIKPDIKVTDFQLDGIRSIFPGPQFGIEGIRKLISASGRSLSCTALKPMGSSPEMLANIAFDCASGGIDIIKDDHGLANQPIATFHNRVRSCVASIRKAEQKSGKKTLYFPNITSRFEDLLPRARFAKENGADGLLISPQLTGLAALSSVAESSLELPIMAHPAFSGPYTIHKNSGFAPDVYFGKLWRALGADAVIYPNAGGRFSYSIEQCQKINDTCRSNFEKFRSVFPVPGGGVNRDTVGEWKNKYGNDTIFLIGGSLYQHPEGIKTAVREFQRSVEEG